MLTLILIIFIAVNSWGVCTSGSYNMGNSSYSISGACRQNYCDVASTICGNVSNIIPSGGVYYADCYIMFNAGNNRTYNCSTGACSSDALNYFISSRDQYSAHPMQCAGSIVNNMAASIVCRSKCSDQVSADSLMCVTLGDRWVNVGNGQYQCISSNCDTTMNCTGYPLFHCTDVPASGTIECYNGVCSGLPYAMWWSEYRRECRNECGDYEENVIKGDTAVTFGTSCDDENEKCGEKKYCTEVGGNYVIYQKCLVGRESVGNVDTRQELPYIVRSGSGTCRGQGMESEKYEGGQSGQGGSQADSLSNDCLLYGVGCPENYKDTIDYDKPENKTPDNDCTCQPFDGMGSMSQITCPNGSISIVYMSCNEWRGIFSSSSAAGGGGVSSSTPTTASSATGGNYSSFVNDSFGQYPHYAGEQTTTNKNVQGALSGISSVLIDIKNAVVSIKDYLFSTPTIGDDVFSLDQPVDSSSYDTTSVNYLDSLYAVLDTAKAPIDTSQKAQIGVCPIISANFGTACRYIAGIAGNPNANMKIDTSNIGGINVCAIIRSLILAFASVVSFIIGSRLFRQINLI